MAQGLYVYIHVCIYIHHGTQTLEDCPQMFSDVLGNMHAINSVVHMSCNPRHNPVHVPYDKHPTLFPEDMVCTCNKESQCGDEHV